MRNIAWPENESVPKSLEEAAMLGWKWNLEERSFESDAEKGIEIGRLEIIKTIGNVTLHATVPYSATLTITNSGPAVDLRAWGETPRKGMEAERKKLFDVVFHPPKQKVVRVRALDANHACEAAADVFGQSLSIRKPDGRRRTIYEWILHKGVVPVTRRNRRAK